MGDKNPLLSSCILSSNVKEVRECSLTPSYLARFEGPQARPFQILEPELRLTESQVDEFSTWFEKTEGRVKSVLKRVKISVTT